MARKEVKSDAHRVLSTEDGLHLKESILWMDAQRSGSLSFLSEATELTRLAGPQIITTEESSRILEGLRKKNNPLICQYNRPFSIGSLRMELLPSGHSLGGASLHLACGKSSILYAPVIQTRKVPVHRGVQLKKAGTLILAARSPEPGQSSKSRNREKERFLYDLQSCISENQWPVVFCHSVATAQEVTRLICEQGIPLSVQSHSYRINKIYESYGCRLGQYSYYLPKRTRNKVILSPLSSFYKSAQLADSSHPLFIVRHHGGPSPVYPRHDRMVREYKLYTSGYSFDDAEILEAVRPKEILFFGPFAGRFAEACQKLTGIRSEALFTNDQPPLIQ